MEICLDRHRSIAGPHGRATTTDTWLTPKFILDALGEFDMDPCAAPEPRPWPTATTMVTLPDNGLACEWKGRVWMNPPYGTKTHLWLARLAAHGSGTALIFARTETDMFFEHVWQKATALLFLRGRLTFCYPAGNRAPHNSGGPSVLCAYGEHDATLLIQSKLDGFYVPIR